MAPTAQHQREYYTTYRCLGKDQNLKYSFYQSHITFTLPFFKKIRFIYFYFWLCWVFVAVCGLSLVAVSGGYSLVVVHGFLIEMASLVAEHRL